MKRFLLYFLIFIFAIPLANGQNIWLNEIHYDNDGSDLNEALEIVLENSGTYTLTDFSIELYNGSNGTVYNTLTLDQFTEGATVGNFTIYSLVLPSNGLQNGAPDGLAIAYQGTLVAGQFLTYEGTMTGTAGSANGVLSTDIGISEPGTTTVGHSLQLTGGPGDQYSSFSWTGPLASSFGAANDGQSFTGGPIDTDPPVWTPGYPAAGQILDTKGMVIVNLDEPGTVYYVVILDGETAPTPAEVKAGVDYGAVTVQTAGSIAVPAGVTDVAAWIEGALPETAYDIYFVAEDDESVPNLQTGVVKLDVTMGAARTLAITNPIAGMDYYLGDLVLITWTSANIDNVLVGGYDYDEVDFFLLTADENEDPLPVPASLGFIPLIIPLEANTDSVDIIVWDATDTSFYERIGPIYLIDTIAPRVETFIPDSGATNVPVNAPFSIEFTEPVIIETGNIYLRKSDGELVETIDIASAYHDLEIIGFVPSQPLEPGTGYYVEMDAGIVSDWKGLLFTGLSGSDAYPFTTASSDLYFSEYIEGSGFNKALEIYNPTSETVDLSNYKLWQISNGGDWPEFTIDLAGSLAPGEVFVVCHTDADAAIVAEGDLVLTMYHNGDDAQGLAKNIGEDVWILIDAIGDSPADPGAGWDVAGITEATKDHTLLRKSNVEIGNTNWGLSAGTSPENSEWKVFDQNFADNLGSPTPSSSDATDIIEFALYDTTGNDVTLSSAVDAVNHTVNVEILFGLDAMVDSLVAVFTLSEGATALPMSEDTVDFSAPVTFTVTAEDEITTQDWTVTVTVAAAQSGENDIIDFVLTEEVIEADKDAVNHTVTAIVEYGTDLSALVPEITISVGAAISPLSGVANDFTNPVVYTVTAQDGTAQDWTVTVTAETPQSVTVYDIQYTTDPSGDSPLAGALVEVSGIVTGVDPGNAFFLQDGEGMWNGVYVFTDRTVAQGDSVTLIAPVKEYFNLTEIFDVLELTVVSSGNSLPAATLVGPGDVDEAYEGVLVTMQDVIVTNDNAGFGMIEISDGTNSLLVDDDIYGYPALLGDRYDLTGMGHYSFGDYKVIPRSIDDFVVLTPNAAPAIGTVSLDPAAPSPTDDVTVTVNITDELALADEDVKLFWGLAMDDYSNEVSFVNIGGDDFAGTIPAQGEGKVYYKIVATDSDRYEPLTSDQTGDYDVVTTGIINVDGLGEISLYPNPTSGMFRLTLTNDTGERLQVEIFSILGAKVYEKTIEASGAVEEYIDLSGRSNGIYLVKISSNQHRVVKKLIRK